MLRRIVLALLLSFCAAVAQTTPAAPPANAGHLIILFGPPLSGKTTFADSISKSYGLPVISIEDLIRSNAAELDKLRMEGVSLAEMRYDPAMSRYIRERFKTTDVSRGVVVDGYPATLVQAEDLAKMLPDLKLNPIAVRLQLPDDVIRARAKETGRESDNPRIIEQRIKDYHREMDSIAVYFPNAKIISVDANQPEAKTWKALQKDLAGAGVKPAAQ